VDETGHADALKLTAAGLKAIAVKEAEAVEAAAGNSTPPGVVPNEIIDHKAAAVNVAEPTAIARPREGSKLAAVADLLRREGGATIDQMADALVGAGHELAIVAALLEQCLRTGFLEVAAADLG
jgi:hypothetical protein